MEDWQRRRRSRNLALALALGALVLMLYAVSFVKTRDLEDKRHRENRQAHPVSPSTSTP